MNELELLAEKESEDAATVVKLISQGKTSAQIHAMTNIPPKRQREIKSQWEALLSNDRWAAHRSKLLIGAADEHYQSIINGLYEVIDDAEQQSPVDYKTKKEALREIANVEKMRIDFFQKAGIIGQQSLGDDLAKMHEEKERITEMLKRIAQKHPEFRKVIATEMEIMNGEVIVTRTVGENE